MNKKGALIAGTVVVIAILVGLYIGNKDYWWFSSDYSQKQTVQSFFKDLTKGDDQSAYNLTTTTFQSNNSYASFQTVFNTYNGSKLSVSYIKHTQNSDGSVNIQGHIKNRTESNNTNFNISVLDGKINAISSQSL